MRLRCQAHDRTPHDKTGDRYEYFTCSGRSRKTTNCTRSAILAERAEAEIERTYQRNSLTQTQAEHVRKILNDVFDQLVVYRPGTLIEAGRVSSRSDRAQAVVREGQSEESSCFTTQVRLVNEAVADCDIGQRFTRVATDPFGRFLEAASADHGVGR